MTKEQKIEKLQNQLENEWEKMHHNASITYPELKNDYEVEMFWDVLSDTTSLWIEDLREIIKEKFGYELTFYSYGRNGATIAPSEFMKSAPCNTFGGLRYDVDEDNIDESKKVLEMLRYINDYWNDTSKYIPQWWKDIKEANEWQADIDEHDGKTKHMVAVWK